MCRVVYRRHNPWFNVDHRLSYFDHSAAEN
ncbi:MAG: tryptophanase leader peptide [Deltaproteobacteria bacterium]|nr:tryptophanase leader peptide [Deltaproteobacteria bacterium]